MNESIDDLVKIVEELRNLNAQADRIQNHIDSMNENNKTNVVEKFNLFMEKMYQLNQLNGLITSHKLKRNLMYIHQLMQTLGLLNNIKKLVVVGKRVNNETS